MEASEWSEELLAARADKERLLEELERKKGHQRKRRETRGVATDTHTNEQEQEESHEQRKLSKRREEASSRGEEPRLVEGVERKGQVVGERSGQAVREISGQAAEERSGQAERARMTISKGVQVTATPLFPGTRGERQPVEALGYQHQPPPRPNTESSERATEPWTSLQDARGATAQIRRELKGVARLPTINTRRPVAQEPKDIPLPFSPRLSRGMHLVEREAGRIFTWLCENGRDTWQGVMKPVTLVLGMFHRIFTYIWPLFRLLAYILFVGFLLLGIPLFVGSVLRSRIEGMVGNALTSAICATPGASTILFWDCSAVTCVHPFDSDLPPPSITETFHHINIQLDRAIQVAAHNRLNPSSMVLTNQAILRLSTWI